MQAPSPAADPFAHQASGAQLQFHPLLEQMLTLGSLPLIGRLCDQSGGMTGSGTCTLLAERRHGIVSGAALSCAQSLERHASSEAVVPAADVIELIAQPEERDVKILAGDHP